MDEIQKIILLGTSLCVVLSAAIIFFVLLYQQKVYKYKKEKLLSEQSHKQEILRTKIEIQEETSTAISREIHDNIGQSLWAAKLFLETWGNPEKVIEVDQAKELLNKAVIDLREVSQALNGNLIETRNLFDSITSLCQMINSTKEFTVTMEFENMELEFPPQYKLIIYRIFQEAIQNVIKHSKATTIKLSVLEQGKFCQFLIEDNGVGISADHKGSNGIINMMKRAEMIGGKLDVGPVANSGTRVTLLVPVIQ